MPELVASVKALTEKTDRLSDNLKSVDDAVIQLTAVVKNLPENYVQREEAEIKAQRVKKWIVGFFLAGVMVAGTVSVSLYSTHKTTCGVRSVVELARTSATRNPIPTNLPDDERAKVEVERAQAADFYTKALDTLPVLWGC